MLTSHGESRPSMDRAAGKNSYDQQQGYPPAYQPPNLPANAAYAGQANGFGSLNSPNQRNGPMPPPAPFNSAVNGNANTSLDARNGRDRTRSQDNTVRERSHTRGTSAGKKARICAKCGQHLTGQFVRALEGTYHLECFTCRDCGELVSSKFFPVDREDGEGAYPLCETDYFRRLDLLCFQCGCALRGSYITALDRKYHIDHFTCSNCPTVFGAQDSYYEHDGKVYCHYHYSTQYAQRCNGCQTAILKQFVEIFRNGQNQHWHPECYMIHKFWNVRLAPQGSESEMARGDEDADEETREQVRIEEEQMEHKVFRIWSVLSAFEESSAACISDMLLHVSNGAYVESVMVAKKFISHVDILFGATDRLDNLIISEGMKPLSYGREAKLLCKKIVAFFTLLSKSSETGVRKLGVTQELLSLVTGLAHYLKLLIRISLQGALKLEKEKKSLEGLNRFLDKLQNLEPLKESDQLALSDLGDSELANDRSDLCYKCGESIDEECVQQGQRRWHRNHLMCDVCQNVLGDDLQGALWSSRERNVICQRCNDEKPIAPDAARSYVPVSRLQQYVYLLRVALARLLVVLRRGGALPHTSDDPNLQTYNSNEGHRIHEPGQTGPPLLRAGSRSKSYAGTAPSGNDPSASSYEETVGEMKRLRSTRLDSQLSTSLRTTRTSRILDGMDSRYGGGQRPQDDAEHDSKRDTLANLTKNLADGVTLDDIPRLVKAQQAKEQRPNAFRHAGLGGSPHANQPKLLSHQRNVSGGQDLDLLGNDAVPQRRKKYFSELSALEYFIVRHVAVLSMEPLLEGQYNLEDLLNLIETRKPTFWGKFGKAFQKGDQQFEKKARPGGGKKKGVFGVSLDTIVEREGVDSTLGVGPGALKVPDIVNETIIAMRGMDMAVEGVFRKNGNIKGLRDLTEKIDQKMEIDLTRESPVQVAALLKKYLRELPDPLMTHKLYRLFLLSQKIADVNNRRRVLHLTCCLLPKAHRDTLEILSSFLVWVSSFSQVDEESGSKMDTHNLATVIAPNILSEKTSTAPEMNDTNFLAIEAVNCLIDFCDEMSEVPEDLQTILNDSSLFNNTSDITTKEILKRYGDIGRSAHRPVVHEQNADGPPPGSKDSNGMPPSAKAAAPVITHVDTDPYQTAWPRDASVRQVHGSAAGPSSFPSSSNQTPPQQYEFSNPASPYHHRGGSSESQASNRSLGPHGHGYKHSGWGKSALPQG